jgi:hypothetical protein
MYRIWLDSACTVCALVSFEDYEWALQWKWQITWDRHRRKMYATRSTTTGERDQHGRKKRIKIYLHKAVLDRSGKVQPCGKHTMGDHGDGDSLNCQRWNLEWATPSQNRRTARSATRREPPADIPY